MSQNEYQHRLVQIIYDTTTLNTTDMFLLQQPKASREAESLTLKFQAHISNKQSMVVLVWAGEGRTTLRLPSQCANI